MDLDLFGAFEGKEKVDEVQAVTQDPSDAPNGEPKDDDATETGSKRKPEDSAATKKRLKGEGGPVEVGVEDGVEAPRAPVQLVHGEESSHIREDGTMVKSYSVYPADWKKDPSYKASAKPAKEYPFTLDPFQKQAIQYIERNESVLVSAHTSAGKTVNAEYAIAKCLRDKQRVIYTSPIKALSNQKFRDLQEEFKDVGLMTGDITINPTASCLIMTTEILRSMLYRGSEVMREVAWVIYDEIHYMRDRTRGVVWEESLILLPDTVRLLFLSATIPNAKEFCGWIVKMHRQPCHVVYTDFRPVPLEHYIFPAGGDGLHLVVDDRGRFRETAFQRAMASLSSTEEEALGGQGGKGRKTGPKKGDKSPTDIKKIVKLIMDKNYEPAIIFNFAKMECEIYGGAIGKAYDFNNDSEQQLVGQIFNNAMDMLSDDDRKLPQVEGILKLLKRGVGIHHGGLLPIVKEAVEILFQEGLIKVLFATETFSIGLNMPARTVIFMNTRKFDGTDFRWITSGEYIQMSGRAGRRGKDSKGFCIQMMDEKMDPQVAKGILYGHADALNSSYHVSYNMLLNMIRVEAANPEYVVKSSFHQYQQEQDAPALEEEAREVEEERAAILDALEDQEEVAAYYRIGEQLKRTRGEARQFVQDPRYCLPFMQPGRLVYIKGPARRNQAALMPASDATAKDKAGEEPQDRKVAATHGDQAPEWGWGAVINLNSRKPTAARDKEGGGMRHEVVVLVMCKEQAGTAAPDGKDAKGRGRGKGADSAPPAGPPVPLDNPLEDKGDMRPLPFALSSVMELSAIRVFMPQDMLSQGSRLTVSKSIREILRRFDNEPRKVNPKEDMGITDTAYDKAKEREAMLQKRMEGMPVHKDKDRDAKVARYAKAQELGDRAKLLRKEARGVQGMVKKDELRRMKRVLRRLGHCDMEGVIQLKGRVACEINTADELVVTELMFNGAFNDLTCEQLAGLLTCLVYQEKSPDEDVKVREQLQGPFRQLQEAARHIAKVKEEAKIEIDTEEYVKAFTPALMDVAYAWASGAKFAQIVDMTPVYEGSIIRAIRRLDELLRQLSQASHNIGNNELKIKFDQASGKIRRDIIFAASLYL